MRLAATNTLVLRRIAWHMRLKWPRYLVIFLASSLAVALLSEERTSGLITDKFEISFDDQTSIAKSLDLSPGIVELNFSAISRPVNEVVQVLKDQSPDTMFLAQVRVNEEGNALEIELQTKEGLGQTAKQTVLDDVRKIWQTVVKDRLEIVRRSTSIRLEEREKFLAVNNKSPASFITTTDGGTIRVVGDSILVATQDVWALREQLRHGPLYAEMVLTQTKERWFQSISITNQNDVLRTVSLGGVGGIFVSLLVAAYLATRRWSPDIKNELHDLRARSLGEFNPSPRDRWLMGAVVAREVNLGKPENLQDPPLVVLSSNAGTENDKEILRSLADDLVRRGFEVRFHSASEKTQDLLELPTNAIIIQVVSTVCDEAEDVRRSLQTFELLGFTRVNYAVLL